MPAPWQAIQSQLLGKKTHIPSAPHTQVPALLHRGGGFPTPGHLKLGLGHAPPSTATGGHRLVPASEGEAASLPEASPQGQHVNPGPPGPGGTVRHPAGGGGAATPGPIPPTDQPYSSAAHWSMQPSTLPPQVVASSLRQSSVLPFASAHSNENRPGAQLTRAASVGFKLSNMLSSMGHAEN